MSQPLLSHLPPLRQVLINGTALTVVLCLTGLASLFVTSRIEADQCQPPLVEERIPYVSNIWQYIVGKKFFFRRVRYHAPPPVW